jgi:hypothetical protein
MISGDVSLQRMRCMFRLRCFGETLSKDGDNLDLFISFLDFSRYQPPFGLLPT